MSVIQYKDSKISYRSIGGKFKELSEKILSSLDTKKITINEIDGSDNIVVENYTNIFNPSHFYFNNVRLIEKNFFLVQLLEQDTFGCSKEIAAFDQIFTVTIIYNCISEQILLAEQSFIDYQTAYLFARGQVDLIQLGLIKKDAIKNNNYLLKYIELHKNLKLDELSESDC